MITKLQVKHIQALADKKSRMEAGEFVVEGDKLLDEVLQSNWPICAIYALPEWIALHANNPRIQHTNLVPVDAASMARISFLKTPSSVLALLNLPTNNRPTSPKHALLVDTLQDPGNLGTIIRIADWFGISTLYLFGACADAFQPKCIQSTMGSFLRVQTVALNTINEVSELPFNNRFAATLHGQAPDDSFIHQPGLLMIGNESKGLNSALQALCTQQVTLPRVGQAESLNAAVATGILCNMWIC